MRYELASFLSKTEQRWLGRFARVSVIDDRYANKHITTFLFRNIEHESDKTCTTDHLYVTVQNKTEREKLLNAPSNAWVFFRGYSSEYYKAAGKDYQIDGIKDLIIFNPELIVENNDIQSVVNLKNANHSNREIALLLNLTPAKVSSIIEENLHLKKKMITQDKAACGCVLALADDGLSINEISNITGLNITEIKRYLETNK